MTRALAALPAVPLRPRPYLAPVPDSLPPFDAPSGPTRPGATVTRLDQHFSATELVELQAATPVSTQGNPRSRVAGDQDGTAAAVRHVATVLTRALVEVLSRRRPVAHLQQYCTPHLFAGLSRYRTTGPLTARTMRLCRPDQDAAEVSVVVQAGDRVRAIAFRMERRERWVITALEIG